MIYFLAIYIPLDDRIQGILKIIALLVLLSRTARKAGKQLIKGVLDENALITISVIGACFVEKSTEGVMVITLYEIGKILEARAVSKTRKSISDLMNLKPEYANLKQGEEVKQVNPEEIQVGDIILVKTGEKIPLDGMVIKGEAEIDNSSLTGESKRIKIMEGTKVLSGGINVQGLFEMKVEKTYENSTVYQILNLVENATDKKAKTETFVAKAAKIYTPIVLGVALLVAIFMPVLVKDITYLESIYKAFIFLVISCPCSIAISVPLSYFSGIGKAAKRGILVKGSDYLDGIKDIGQIIFDKTGTITTGEFKVKSVNRLKDSYKQEEILNYFAMGESFSNHPIAKSILKEVKQEVDTRKVTNFEEIAGKGVQYNYEGKEIKIGNASFVGYPSPEQEMAQTTIFLKIGEEVAGSIVLTDEIKPGAKATIKKLKELGIKIKMFTGDKKEIAEAIANELKIEEVRAEMLPQHKYEELEKVLDSKIGNQKVAYVGDGINDSPVLARSDLGISMGGMGSSSAIEASDMVIMTDELEKILEAIQISKKTNQIIQQNLIFSIGVKILTLLLSLFGIADMWEAVFADVGTTLITIFNTLRILK
ncbi:MAG: cadmium-translocating P-type ATPase [Clostridia bacterium]|nr:cadmium-translocating P-type ATPase [Clostridia bacterium]